MTESRVTLVVGGTKGIGAAVTRRLARRGPVVAAYRSDDAAAAVLADGAGAEGLPVSTSRCDVSTKQGADEVIDHVLELHGRLDAVVFTAVDARLSSPLTVSEEDWHAVFASTTSPFLWLGQRMAQVQTDSGRLIALTSPWSHRYVRGYCAVGPAKAALESLVVYLAAELAPRGVTVNAVSAGLVDTALMRSRVPAAHIETVTGRTPAGRIGTPADLTDMIEFLVGEQAAMVTGQVMTVDGGYFLR